MYLDENDEPVTLTATLASPEEHSACDGGNSPCPHYLGKSLSPGYIRCKIFGCSTYRKTLCTGRRIVLARADKKVSA